MKKYDIPLLSLSLLQVKILGVLAQMYLDDVLLGFDKMPSIKRRMKSNIGFEKPCHKSISIYQITCFGMF